MVPPCIRGRPDDCSVISVLVRCSAEASPRPSASVAVDAWRGDKVTASAAALSRRTPRAPRGDAANANAPSAASGLDAPRCAAGRGDAGGAPEAKGLGASFSASALVGASGTGPGASPSARLGSVRSSLTKGETRLETAALFWTERVLGATACSTSFFEVESPLVGWATGRSSSVDADGRPSEDTPPPNMACSQAPATARVGVPGCSSAPPALGHRAAVPTDSLCRAPARGLFGGVLGAGPLREPTQPAPFAPSSSSSSSSSDDDDDPLVLRPIGPPSSMRASVSPPSPPSEARRTGRLRDTRPKLERDAYEAERRAWPERVLASCSEPPPAGSASPPAASSPSRSSRTKGSSSRSERGALCQCGRCAAVLWCAAACSSELGLPGDSRPLEPPRAARGDAPSAPGAQEEPWLGGESRPGRDSGGAASPAQLLGRRDWFWGLVGPARGR